MMPSLTQLELWLFTVLCAGLKAYLAAYLKRKAEDLATREALADLVKQVEATTAATKSIEAKISNEMWDRQGQWEMKRDLLFDAVRTVGDSRDKYFALPLIGAYPSEKSDEAKEQWQKESRQAVAVLQAPFDKLAGLVFLARVLCSDAMVATLHEYDHFVKGASVNIIAGVAGIGEWGHYKSRFAEHSREVIRSVRAAILANLQLGNCASHGGGDLQRRRKCGPRYGWYSVQANGY
jgi:hypothetical protein